MTREPGRRWLSLPAALRRRGLVLFVGSTLYASAAAIERSPEAPRRAWSAGIVALVVAWLATRPALTAPEKDRRERVPPLPAASYATWGLALTLVALAEGGPEAGPARGAAWLFALGTIGAAIAALAGAAPPEIARRRLGVAASLPPHKEGPRLLGTAWIAATAGLVAVLGAFPRAASFTSGREVEDALGAWFGAFGFVALAGILADRLRAARLVLGAAERARASLGAVVGIFLVALAAAATRAGEPPAILRVALAAAGVAASVASAYPDAVRLARVARRALALGLFGGPVVLLTVIATEGPAGSNVLAALLGGLAALAVGTLGAWLESPLRPGEGRWLDAFVEARAELARADPETSTQGALRALRAGAGTAAQSPELWSLDPVRVATIDAAGYARERDAALPPLLLEVAAAEPEATLRTELLDALLVRRPDLRALARWMDERGALSATLVTREGEVLGALVVPRGAGREPMTLEEAQAAKALADAMSGACAAKSAFARSLARERDATARADALELVVERARHAEALAAGRVSLEVARETRGAEVGRYSPEVRFAQAALERRVAAGAPVVLVGPSGLDPVPHLAAAYLASPRRPGAPFVVVDGAASASHDPSMWRDPSASPLALAHGGLLVLVDGAALPPEAQGILARALGERRAPWGDAEPLEVAIALTSTRPLAELARAGRLDPALATRLGDPAESEIVLPPLERRPEDLRALLSDRLAREGLRQRGAPLGIDDAAFARLADYPFPGDLAELALVARRLVAGASGDVVRLADVEALGLPETVADRVNVRASSSLS